MKDNTTKLLGLEDVIVKNVYEDADGCHVELELPRQEHTCPCCGARTDRVHDYRMQKIKDLPISGKNTYLHLRKRRYVCESCGKRFYEDSSFLSRYYRVTSRMVASIINRFRSTVSATDIARESNISVSTALRYFDLVDYRCHHLPEVLSIDEFKGNAGGEKFQTILADADRQCVIDILPNRKSADLIRYFLKFPRKERLKVKCVVMDMSSLFRGVIQTCFPNAIIVADRYHVVRQAVWAMENVRKNVQKKLSPEWRKFFKRSQCLLNKSHVRIAYKTSSTSILFLQYIIDSLANGGRCAMVIDEGVLFRTNELEAVTGGTEPVEWSIPENGLPRPNGRYPEPEHNVPTWTPNTNEETGLETPKPGTYEIYGVAWGQD